MREVEVIVFSPGEIGKWKISSTPKAVHVMHGCLLAHALSNPVCSFLSAVLAHGYENSYNALKPTSVSPLAVSSW